MNEFIAMLILAIVQGATEWLPVSSSGHLVLVSNLIGFENSLFFDVALHFGTLMAVFVYFGRDIVDMLEALLKGQWKSKEARMAYLLAVSAVPASVAGFLFRKYFEDAYTNIAILAIGFGITSIVLFIASMDFGKGRKEINYTDAFLIGCAQIFSIFSSISRSGVTISTGLLRGLDEKTALKFSFLMSIPVIFGASLIEIGNRTIPAKLLLPTFISFLVGIVTIHFLLKVVLTSKKNLRWFAVYTLLLAIGIGIWLLIR